MLFGQPASPVRVRNRLRETGQIIQRGNGETDKDHDRNGFTPGSSRPKFAEGVVLKVWI